MLPLNVLRKIISPPKVPDTNENPENNVKLNISLFRKIVCLLEKPKTQRCCCEEGKACENDGCLRKKVIPQSLRDARLDLGLCVRCGEEPLICKTLGSKCILKRAACRYLGNSDRYLELFNLLYQQDNSCSYCGEPVILGQNANVGHKTSVSRAQKNKTQITTIDNLHWLCKFCNAYQGRMNHREFLEHCVMIHNLHKNTSSSDEYILHLNKICDNLNLCPNLIFFAA